MRPRPGRPPRTGRRASASVLQIRCTEQEKRDWKRAAKRSDMTLSDWLRWCAANFVPDE